MSERFQSHPIHSLPDSLVPQAFLSVDIRDDTVEEDFGGVGNGLRPKDDGVRIKEKMQLRRALGEIEDTELLNQTNEYLDKIGKIPLLTAEEERALGQWVSVGLLVQSERKEKTPRRVAANLVQKLHNGRRALFRYFPPQAFTVKGIMTSIEESHGMYPQSLVAEVMATFPEGLTEEQKREAKKVADKKGDAEIKPVSLAALALPDFLVEAYVASLVEHNATIIRNALENVPTDVLRQHFDRLEQRGRIAEQEMMEANLKLGVSVAANFIGRGVLLPDLIQQSSVGLKRAVEMYDYRRGYKFSTYAYKWIRQAVSRGVAKEAKTIRISTDMQDYMSAYFKATEVIWQRKEDNPTQNELAEEMGVSTGKIQEIEAVIQQRTVSLTASIGDSENEVLEGRISDIHASNPQVALDKTVVKEGIENVLSSLSEREQKVLRLRFGLEDGRERTLEEIAQEIGVSRERIRQNEAEALTKLRQGSMRARLQELDEG